MSAIFFYEFFKLYKSITQYILREYLLLSYNKLNYEQFNKLKYICIWHKCLQNIMHELSAAIADRDLERLIVEFSRILEIIQLK